MRIACPHCGPRDVQEFTCLGDANPTRPEGMETTQAAMADYVYQRDNPAGAHRELWYHGAGCHAWLVVSRNTRSHAIAAVETMAQARAGARGATAGARS